MPTTSELGLTAEVTWRLHPTKLSVVVAVGRRLLPFLVEATLIPTLLFYIFVASLGLIWAFVAATCWSFACVARRLARREAIPGLLVLACLGITVRLGIYLWSSNAVVYLVQPVLRTIITAGAFALSVRLGRAAHRPVRARLLPTRPRGRRPAGHRSAVPPADLPVGRRQRRARRAVSLSLLWTVSTATFVGATTVATWVVTGDRRVPHGLGCGSHRPVGGPHDCGRLERDAAGLRPARGVGARRPQPGRPCRGSSAIVSANSWMRSRARRRPGLAQPHVDQNA